MWQLQLPANFQRWKTCSPSAMFLVAGQLPNPNILVTMAFTPRQSLKPKGNDDNHSSIDRSNYSPPCPLGSVGNPIRRVDLCHVHAAHPAGSHLSGRIERRVGYIVAFHFPADCLGRAETDTLDLGIDGYHQRRDGDIDSFRIGTLRVPRKILAERNCGFASCHSYFSHRCHAGGALRSTKFYRSLAQGSNE